LRSVFANFRNIGVAIFGMLSNVFRLFHWLEQEGNKQMLPPSGHAVWPQAWCFHIQTVIVQIELLFFPLLAIDLARQQLQLHMHLMYQNC